MLAAGAIGRTILAKANSKTYLPDILDLKGKVIKYLDCLNNLAVLDRDGVTITTGQQNDVYLNLMKSETKEIFIKNVPLSNYQVSERKGIRDNISRVVDFPNSWVENYTNSDVVLFLVFWYDDIQISNLYSQQDRTNIESFEVNQFNTTQQRMMFDEDRTLVNKEIQDFYVFDNQAAFITPTGKTSVTGADIKNSYLTLVKANFEFVKNVPLILFKNSDVYKRIKLQNIVFDFSNSWIDVPPTTAANVNGKSYFFNIEYKN